jgi:Uma2 family endonuclease
MGQVQLMETPADIAPRPDIADLITEDDTPVDNWYSEKQQRLLTEPLYSTWAGPGDGRPFLVAANVGIFYQTHTPAIVPDAFLSLDVQVAKDWLLKEHRSYFIWEFGKIPEVVIEVVSNTVGGEADDKLRKYARIGISYYVIHDPLLQLMPDVLTIYQLRGLGYVRQTDTQLPGLPLGLTLWEGTYEGKQDIWLRWTDADGGLILTGKERADLAQQQVVQAQQQVVQERLAREQAQEQLAQAEQQAERLAALLRQLGHDPDQV